MLMSGIVLILLVFFVSCGINNLRNTEVLQQRIRNSNKVVCIYLDGGGWVGSTTTKKTAIIDASKVLKMQRKSKDIPYFIYDIDIKSKKIYCIEFVDKNEEEKNGVYEKKYDDMRLIIKKMRGNKSNTGMYYKYGRFVETNDSIFFYDVVVDYFGILLPDTVGFKKGNITAFLDRNDFVIKFDNEIYSTYPLWEEFRTKLRNGIAVDMGYSEEVLNTNLFELPAFSTLYKFNIVMRPATFSGYHVISDYGIFKNIYPR